MMADDATLESRQKTSAYYNQAFSIGKILQKEKLKFKNTKWVFLGI
jgi:hypothetical protein